MIASPQPSRLIVQGKKHKLKKFYILTIIFLLLCLLGSGVAIVGYQTYDAKYHSYLTLAQTGIKHLQTAMTLMQTLPKKPLDAPTVNQARHEFSTASATFIQLDNGLKSLPGISTSIPVYGARLSAALHVLPLAIEVSQAGLTGCDALNLIISRFHDPLSTGHGLTMVDFSVIEKDFQQVKGILNLAVKQVNALQPGDLQLDSRIGKIVATFHKYLPTLNASLVEVEKLLAVAPTLLGIEVPTNYLIEILDSSELRPAGGFIGNYGIATVSGARLTTAHITDSYLLDKAFVAAGHNIPYPSTYSWFDLAPGSWSFRDSNLDADFPTAARYAEKNYHLEGGNMPVQGVIAITPVLIEHALVITGPINIPEYHETVTAQNLVDRIHFHQLGPGREGGDISAPDGHSSVRKHFTELLAEHFLARVHQLPSTALSKFLQLMVGSLHSKDLQIYLNSSIAENLLQSNRLGAIIQPPADDSLFVVDANISPSKANQFITNTLNDQVTIDANGNAIHHTAISYAWVTNGPIYGASLYRDYMRVYVPLNSTLHVQDGWQPRGTSKAFGSEVWAGFFTLSYGQTRTITFIWTVPNAASKDGHRWHYQYLIQRQAGAQWKLNLQFLLPSCAAMTNKLGGLVSSTSQKAVLRQSLNEDMNVGIDYTC